MEAAHMTESDFRRICRSAGWDIDWPTDYFKDSQPIYKVFSDLIEPQGYGFFTYDPKSLPDRFNDLRKHVPLDDITFDDQTQYVAESLTFPYKTVSRYEIITLSHDGMKLTIVGDHKDSLLRQTLGIASQDRVTIMRSAESFFDEDDEYDFYDFYLVVPTDITPGQMTPFNYTNQDEQVDIGAFLAAVNHPAVTKYFYIPYITSKYIRAQAGEEVGSIEALTYDSQPAYCASSVLPGQTLAEAIKNDLEKDFHYPGAFTVADYRYLDFANDKSGIRLPRIAVHVQVESFDVAVLTIIDKTPQWQTMPDNVFAYYGLGVGIRAEPVDHGR